jgi:hypothetical protein
MVGDQGVQQLISSITTPGESIVCLVEGFGLLYLLPCGCGVEWGSVMPTRVRATIISLF